MSKSMMYLKDISTSMNRIATYMHGVDFESFSSNEMILDAVIRNLEIIGEAARKMPVSIREKYNEVPWIEMTATGTFLIEEYDSVDVLTVWDVVVLLLRHLRSYIVRVIEIEQVFSVDDV